MEIFLKNQNHRRLMRARRGAALMYALLVVFILSLILLAMGGLVTSHLKEEENAAAYSRLLYSAEAAANWQLLQVSRTVPNLPNGAAPSNPGAGFQTMSSLNTSPPANYTDINDDIGKISDSNRIQIHDNVRTWVTDTAGPTWAPPNDCVIYAVATDPLTGMRRAVSLHAAGTKLADRFTIFGRNSVTFNASGSQKCAIARGFIGSNGLISSIGGNPPTTVPNAGLGGFRGCLLTGPQAQLGSTAGWPTNLDYPQLPDPTVLPSIDQIVSYMTGADISALKGSPLTRNVQGARSQLGQYVQPIDNRDGDNYSAPYPAIGAMVSMNYRVNKNTFNSTQFKTLGPVTSLGNNQFAQSVFADDPASPTYYPPPVNPATGNRLRIIRLHSYLSDIAARSDQDPNVFYFSNIQMGPDDVLLLDVAQPTASRAANATACRIVIHNNSLTGPIKITNVAIVQVTNADKQHSGKENLGDSSFIFYNDTNQPLQFKPTLALPATTNAFYDSRKDKLSVDTQFPQNTDFPSLAYILTPGCPGLAYGIRPANTALPTGVNDLGGAITIDGTVVPCTVVGAIANQVTLLGNVTVGQVVTQYSGNPTPYYLGRYTVIEAPNDITRYQYSYHATSSYREISPDDVVTASSPAFGYGRPPE